MKYEYEKQPQQHDHISVIMNSSVVSTTRIDQQVKHSYQAKTSVLLVLVVQLVRSGIVTQILAEIMEV